MADEIVSFKIKGLAELQHALEEKLPKEARLAMRIALSAGGGTVKDAMVAGAPVETGDNADAGFLRDHIKVKTVIGRDGLSGRALVGATTAAYPGHEGKRGQVTFKTKTGRLISFVSNKAGQVTAAMVARFLEFGTSRMAKHPFMTTAWDEAKQAAFDRIIQKLREALHL